MTKSTMTLKKLRTRVESCLTEGFTLAFFLPDLDKRPPTWNEVREAAMDGYGLALGDIPEAIDGDTEGLEQARSEEGRIAIKEEDWPLFEALTGVDPSHTR